MLYVFLVDTGVMLSFEMELAMESVHSLMNTIAKMLKIPIEKQVLIMQGGQTLDAAQRICNYSSGENEDNPIFLFSKSTIESSVPPAASVNMGSEATFKEEVEISSKLPPTYDTVVSRAQLALRFQDMSTELCDSCIQLVNEQYLQRQGWHAVIANLEKIASTFETRATLLEENYKEFKKTIPQNQGLLDNFPEVIGLLKRVPVFSCLLSTKAEVPAEKESVTLLDWINSQDARNDLEDMLRQCCDALEQIKKLPFGELIGERDNILGDISNHNMKDIGGLEERLNLLSKLCDNARMLKRNQSDMAQGFSQNQLRAQNLGDVSVLPDLCSSHQEQLSLLMKNYSQLRDIRRRCAKAKDELSSNLHARLRWVMAVEKRICDCDNKLVLYHESMKRIKKRVEILEQIKQAPRVYIETIKEVVRRRNFASKYVQWSQLISSDSREIYEDEMHRRREFSSFIGNHFLNALFEGINDVPMPFAHSGADLFDNELAAVTPSDFQSLKDTLPEQLSAKYTLDDISHRPLEENIFKRTELPDRDSTENCELGVDVVNEPDHSGPECSSSVKEHESDTKEIDRDRTCDSLNSPDFLRILASNSAVKENSTIIVNRIRAELHYLKETAVLSKETLENLMFETRKHIREITNTCKKSVPKEEPNSCKIEQLTASVDTLNKKIDSLTSENESLRKELRTKEEFLNEEVLKYRGDLKKQKELIRLMELEKERFEAEQQIRFNSTINKVLKEKDVALKKADEQLSIAKDRLMENEERLQIVFNEKETLRLHNEHCEEELRSLLKQKKEVEKCLYEAKIEIEEKEQLVKKYTEKENLQAGQVFDELLIERFQQRIKHLEEENMLLRDSLHSDIDGKDKVLFVELQQTLAHKTKECEALTAELELLQQKPRSSQVVFKDFQKGDIVQVYFNDEKAMYMIRTVGETPYFLHMDSMVNLELTADVTTRSPFQAQILDKEYCQAKKANNRFKVPVGTKFYRVKVRPWTINE